METKKKIKIAQVITRLDWSGAPDILCVICGRLDTSRYDVTLIYGPTIYPTEKTKEFLKNFTGKVMIVPSLKREVSLFEDLTTLAKLYKIFLRGKFDIVHTHTAKAGFIGRIAARTAGTPLVMHTPHGHDFYGYFNSLGSGLVVILERIAALFADRIIVLTGMEKADMLKYRICPARKIAIIQSGVDFSGFEKIKRDAVRKKTEFGIGENELVVGMVGRLENIKGFEYFIDSARIILDTLPQTRFLIVGDGSLRRDLEDRTRRLKIEDNVVFAGWRNDIPDIMAILDVLVLASLNEAVGRVLIEAGAAGKPAVATAVGGIPDILKDNETGIIIQPRDPESIARAVIELLKNEKKRLEMGRAARERVRNNFDEQTMFNKFDRMYKELTRG